MNILQFSYGSPGCIYYRNLNMVEVFKAMGHDSKVIESPLTKKEDFMEAGALVKRWADIIVVTRFNDWTSMVNLAHQYGKRVVYEFDDTPDLHKAHSIYKLSLAHRWSEVVAVQATHADAVTASTEDLAIYARQFNDNVFVLPNMIDYNLPIWNREKREDDGTIVIGYFGGSSHFLDLKSIEKPIKRILREFPMVRWHYGAFPDLAYIKQLDSKANKMTTSTQTGRDVVMAKNMRRMFSSIKRKKLKYLHPYKIDVYGGVYSQFDIGIVPLTKGDFNIYKSNLKLLEYGAYDVPVVAQDLNPYSDTIKNSGGGFLAKSEEDFYQHLKKLVKSEELRLSMGAKLGEYVRQNYNLHKNGAVYMDAYAEIAQLEPKTRQAPSVPSVTNEQLSAIMT